jgi:hypothetical protein
MSMGWKYEDLSEEEQDKIGFVLPEGWEHEGTPGDQFWPVFKCPFCGEDNLGEWGGCEHLAYIYTCEGSYYEFLNPDLSSILDARMKSNFPEYKLEEVYDEDVPTPPWFIADKDGHEIGLEAIFPELKEIVYYGGWTCHAGFLRLIAPKTLGG